jgi:hypothetical protein
MFSWVNLNLLTSHQPLNSSQGNPEHTESLSCLGVNSALSPQQPLWPHSWYDSGVCAWCHHLGEMGHSRFVFSIAQVPEFHVLTPDLVSPPFSLAPQAPENLTQEARWKSWLQPRQTTSAMKSWGHEPGHLMKLPFTASGPGSSYSFYPGPTVSPTHPMQLSSSAFPGV